MATKKTPTKNKIGADKPTRAGLARAAKKHYPKVKAAAEKALADAGLGDLRIHGMMFAVNENDVADNCDPPCAPNEKCRLSSTGDWVCVPKS